MLTFISFKKHVSEISFIHYTDVIMTTMGSQITSLTVVYSTVYSDADQRKHQSSASLAFVWGIHRDRWIPRTKGQLRGKFFHLMTSSCKISLLNIGETNCSTHLNKQSFLNKPSIVTVFWITAPSINHLSNLSRRKFLSSMTAAGKCGSITNSVTVFDMIPQIPHWSF